MKYIIAITLPVIIGIGFWYLAGAPYPGRYQIVSTGRDKSTVIDTMTGKIVTPKGYTVEEIEKLDSINCSQLSDEIHKEILATFPKIDATKDRELNLLIYAACEAAQQDRSERIAKAKKN